MRDSALWIFEALSVHRVVDGDSFWLVLDVGFRQTQLTEIRLLGFDAPELFGPKSDHELAKAREAKGMVESWLDQAMADPSVQVWVRTEKDPDKYGRWLGDVHTVDSDGRLSSRLGDDLRAADLATEWPTRWREEFDQGAPHGD